MASGEWVGGRGASAPRVILLLLFSPNDPERHGLALDLGLAGHLSSLFRPLQGLLSHGQSCFELGDFLATGSHPAIPKLPDPLCYNLDLAPGDLKRPGQVLIGDHCLKQFAFSTLNFCLDLVKEDKLAVEPGSELVNHCWFCYGTIVGQSATFVKVAGVVICLAQNLGKRCRVEKIVALPGRWLRPASRLIESAVINLDEGMD